MTLTHHTVLSIHKVLHYINGSSSTGCSLFGVRHIEGTESRLLDRDLVGLVSLTMKTCRLDPVPVYVCTEEPHVICIQRRIPPEHYVNDTNSVTG